MKIWSDRDVEVAYDVVARWRAQPAGTPLRSVSFPAAQRSMCHENVALYVAEYGGEMVGGFLVERVANAPWVYIRAHSVVRMGNELIDPTLSTEDLKAQAFFEHLGPVQEFRETAQRWAQMPVQIPQPEATDGSCL